MKKYAILTVVIFAALLISSSAFGQMCEKMKMGGATGEGMPKMMMKCCGMNPEMMMKCCGMHSETKGMGCGMGMMEGKMNCCKEEFFLCCKDQLELTDGQVASLKSIKMSFLKDKIQKEADLEVAELELKDFMSADKMDMAKVEKQIRNIHGMKAEKKIAHLKAFEKAKTVLTPEQLEKQKEHHKMMMKGM